MVCPISSRNLVILWIGLFWPGEIDELALTEEGMRDASAEVKGRVEGVSQEQGLDRELQTVA
jgi:hypothetical protein